MKQPKLDFAPTYQKVLESSSSALDSKTSRSRHFEVPTSSIQFPRSTFFLLLVINHPWSLPSSSTDNRSEATTQNKGKKRKKNLATKFSTLLMAVSSTQVRVHSTFPSFSHKPNTNFSLKTPFLGFLNNGKKKKGGCSYSYRSVALPINIFFVFQWVIS